jgi:hypothetical protein
MIDIGSFQICSFSHPFAEFEKDFKSFFAQTFNFKFMFIAPELIRRNDFLLAALWAI